MAINDDDEDEDDDNDNHEDGIKVPTASWGGRRGAANCGRSRHTGGCIVWSPHWYGMVATLAGEKHKTNCHIDCSGDGDDDFSFASKCFAKRGQWVECYRTSLNAPKLTHAIIQPFVSPVMIMMIMAVMTMTTMIAGDNFSFASTRCAERGGIY